jgi:hypothetical protein
MVDCRRIGNAAVSVRVNISLTVRHTSQTGTKVGSSDPLILSGQVSD